MRPHSQLPGILDALFAAGCAVRGDGETRALDARVTPAEDEDWVTEYLAPVISAKVVDGVDEAIAHINRYGSHHTESIVAEEFEITELDCTLYLRQICRGVEYLHKEGFIVIISKCWPVWSYIVQSLISLYSIPFRL